MKKGALFLLFIFLLVGLFAWWRFQPVASLPAAAVVVTEPTPSPAPVKRGRYCVAAVPKKLEKRISMDKGFALGFANFLCGVSYTNCQATTVALNNMVNKSLRPMFANQFFSPEVVKDIYDRELVMSFKLTNDIIPIEVGDTMDKFLVEGVLTTKSDRKGGAVIERQPVAMIVGFAHGLKTDNLIDVFEKADPSEETLVAAKGK